MTQTFGQNSAGDIYIGADGNLVILSSLPAVEAACATASLTQLGECVLQQNVGIPNFQSVWVGVPDLNIWKSYLENTLLNVESVTQVNSIQAQSLDNILTYIATIQTAYGSTTISN